MTTTTKQLSTHTPAQAVNYSLRTEYRDGKKWLVAPVVMMVEGVHCGSRGPVYHTVEALESSVPLWEGHPVTIYHPQDAEGNYLSGHEEASQRSVVGEVRNAWMDNNKLKAEIWLNEQRLMAVSPQALTHIQQGRPLDVSTGVFTQEEAVAGEWNGEQYESIAVQHQPDHLALLPGERGACSWQDGCGIRVNHEHPNQGGDMPDKEKEGLLALFKQVKEYGLAVTKLQVNELGFRELASKVQRKLDRLDSEARMHFLYDVYEDHFIYSVHDRDNETERHYRQTYTTNEADEVEFTGDPEEVRKQVEFVAMTNNTTMKRTKQPTNNQTQSTMEKEKAPCGDCMEKVVGLINNERTRFTKADREWLLALNEEQLDKLEPTEAPAPQVNREQALEVLREELADAEKLVGLLPGELKDQVEAGLTLHKEERTKLVKAIQANTEKDTWGDEELAGMDMTTLRKLEKSSRKADYSGSGGGRAVQTNTETSEDKEFLAPAGIEVE